MNDTSNEFIGPPHPLDPPDFCARKKRSAPTTSLASSPADVRRALLSEMEQLVNGETDAKTANAVAKRARAELQAMAVQPKVAGTGQSRSKKPVTIELTAERTGIVNVSPEDVGRPLIRYDPRPATRGREFAPGLSPAELIENVKSWLIALTVADNQRAVAQMQLGLHLLELKRRKPEGLTWPEYLAQSSIGLKVVRANELIRIAEGRTTTEQAKAATRNRVERHRTLRNVQSDHPVVEPVEITEIITPEPTTTAAVPTDAGAAIIAKLRSADQVTEGIGQTVAHLNGADLAQATPGERILIRNMQTIAHVVAASHNHLDQRITRVEELLRGRPTIRSEIRDDTANRLIRQMQEFLQRFQPDLDGWLERSPADKDRAAVGQALTLLNEQLLRLASETRGDHKVAS